VDLLGRIAEQKKATPAQIALAWLLAQKRGLFRSGHDQVVSPRREQWLARIKLNIRRPARNRQCGSKITVQGDRYPEHLLRMSGR